MAKQRIDMLSPEDSLTMARELGISKSWASRLHTSALRALRQALDAG